MVLMKKDKSYVKWIFIVISIPFALMLGLHVTIALGNYFGVNINIDGVTAKDWFIFASSYLGGAMTLIGVMLTLKYERALQKRDEEIKNIELEQKNMGEILCKLDFLAPYDIIQDFYSLLNVPGKGYDSRSIALIKSKIIKETSNIHKLRVELTVATDIYSKAINCPLGSNDCDITDVKLKFCELYDKVTFKLLDVLQQIKLYVEKEYNNSLYNVLIYNFNSTNTISRRCLHEIDIIL